MLLGVFLNCTTNMPFLVYRDDLVNTQLKICWFNFRVRVSLGLGLGFVYVTRRAPSTSVKTPGAFHSKFK